MLDPIFSDGEPTAPFLDFNYEIVRHAYEYKDNK